MSQHRDTRFSEGLAAGLLFAVSDALATGRESLDGPLLLAIGGSGLAVGVAAGLLGCVLRRPGLAIGLLLAALHGLQWSAVLSREFALVGSTARSIIAVGLTLSAAALAVIAIASRGRPAGVVAALLVIPAAELLPWRSSDTGLIVFALLLAPLVALAALAADRRFARAPARVGIGVALACWLVLLGSAWRSGEPPSRASLSPVAGEAAPDAPNLLLVVVDTLRADHVLDGAASPGTPNLARLAAAGAVFTEAISSASWTLPSHGSLLTGIAPCEHGAMTSRLRLAADCTTLAERLQQEGYATAAFTGGAFVTEATGLDQGFETFDARAEWNFAPFTRHTPLVWRVARNRWFPLLPLIRRLPRSGGMQRVVDCAVDWLEVRDRSRPFFLFVHTYQVHDYYLYQGVWDDSVATAGSPFAGRFRGRLWVAPEEIAAGITAEEAAAFAQIYRHRVELVDAALGSLLARAEPEARGRGLVTVVTSDHGEGFDFDAGRLMHGGRVTDDLLHVPLIVAAPGGEGAGGVFREQVRLVDVVPTLLDHAGLALPPGLQGRSMRPLIAGNDEGPRYAWSEDGSGPRRLVSLRGAGWKLVRHGEEWHAFDLRTDPREQVDRIEQVPALLRAAFVAAEQALAPRDASAAEFDEATAEQLNQLGYTR